MQAENDGKENVIVPRRPQTESGDPVNKCYKTNTTSTNTQFYAKMNLKIFLSLYLRGQNGTYRSKKCNKNIPNG